MNSNHTPFQAVKSRSAKGEEQWHIACSTHVVMGKVYSQGTAEFIVQACNSHEVLVEALHAIIQLDHHNQSPESQVTKMARAALNAVEDRHGQ